MTVKYDRISSLVQRELANIIANDTKSDIIKNVNITDCEVTNDLSYAKIYYTFLGDYSKEEIASELEKHKPFLRKTLSSRVDLRHTPELIFNFDSSTEYGNKIDRLLDKINKE